MKKERCVILQLRSRIMQLVCLLVCWIGTTHADVGELIWEDNFDTLNLNHWTIDEGDGCAIGLCGWGNAELQSYSANNVSIQGIPGEPGNNALVLEAKRENSGASSFTSGKVQSENKVSVQYGMIEVRMQVPDLDQGLWPAAWLLGTTTLGWPAKGEIDMMEMGHRVAAREEWRQYNSDPNDNGDAAPPINHFTGSNLIFYADAACSEGNPTCAASLAYQNDNAHVSTTPLSNRFVVYRTYWTSSEIRFAVVDNGIEYDMYETPFPLGPETSAFQAPFYLLLNLAVGGNFTDAATSNQVNAPLPAQMLIDYVRIYQLDGEGEVTVGDQTQPETGIFGVFTDNSATTNRLEAGVSSDIFLWDTNSSEGNISAFEGENVIAWSFNNPGNWFGGGVQSRQARDMSNFTDGNLTFYINIPADVSFRVGVTDTFTNENWLNFPAGQTTYGLVRNGDWGKVTIPVTELRGSLIALQSMQYLFAIASDPNDIPGTSFQYAIDDVLWEGGGGPLDSDSDGVPDSSDNCPNTPLGLPVDANGCPLDAGPGVQFGEVTISQSNSASWTSVVFDNDFTSLPIVTVGAASFNGSQAGALRVRNVTTSGFEVQFDEWDYLDGSHVNETVGYIAALEGAHNWGGLSVVAGSVANVNQSWRTANFPASFTTTPIIVSQQVSDNEASATAVRVRNISASSFQLQLEEEEAADGIHPDERVNFIAVEAGIGEFEGRSLLAATTSNSVTHNWFDVSFGAEYTNSIFLADMQTTDGGDTATVRYQNLTSNGVQVKIHEEQSRDSEIAHTSEVVGYLLVGDPVGVNDSDNDGVPDNEDVCPNTPANTTVGPDGCALVNDTDGDGVDDSNDLCPNTLSGAEVDSSGCEIQPSVFGVVRVNEDTAEFFVNTTAWADIHYSLNGGGQQNVRMIQTGSRNIFNLTGLNEADQVSYNFTYFDTEGNFAVDTENEIYIHSGGASLDSDNDGVADGDDDCPNTPPGTEVDGSGCPLVVDSDDDGVPDVNDNCPGTPAGVPVDGSGCELPSTQLPGTASASSQFQPAALAFDGDMGTRWESTHGVDPSWISLDLGDVYSLTEVIIHWEAANAESYLIEGSNNNSQWTQLASFSGGAFGARTDSLALSGQYQFVRLYATSRSEGNYWGYSVFEMEVYGVPGRLSDSDGDGVVDEVDQCPNTPAGTAVDSAGCSLVIENDDDGDGVANGNDNCPGTPAGTVVDGVGCAIDLSGDIVPLFDINTQLEQDIVIETETALVTRISDRGRDRHAREDQFQAYDHYLTFYWEDRTAGIEIIDTVAKGGDTITINATTEFPLDTNDGQGQNEAELRFLYRGINTVAEYMANGAMVRTIDDLHYTRSINQYEAVIPGTTDVIRRPFQIGDRVEFELSQFLEEDVPNGRANYYGTTYLYVIGEGIVPWEARGVFGDLSTEREDSYPIAQSAWLGGQTTLPYQYSNEPDDHFMQMATNIGFANAQPFVLGRRLHHTNFDDGSHDEPGNPTFPEMVGKAGTHYINAQCSSCHERNGRSFPAAIGTPLDKWVFKVGDINGNADPQRGKVLQPKNVDIDNTIYGEGTVSIASWSETNGLRSPNYSFERGTPATFSARIAPQLVGLGLLEAVAETTILALADENDDNNDGISGKAQRVVDPVTGQLRLGRFGWKASTSSLKHQIAAALNTDLGVMTSVLPNPDCGSVQAINNVCGSTGAELSDSHLEDLVKYIALLGVRAQRNVNNAEVQIGQAKFIEIGCESCHTQTLQTSSFHPFGELRNQTIHPYSDMLLHDMGPGLADNLGEADASGAEWRTTPLWGIGLSACVSGGVDHSPGQGSQFCTPKHSYLHDGRARSIEEAILWHGGEGLNSKNNYESLSAADKQAVLRFLESL